MKKIVFLSIAFILSSVSVYAGINDGLVAYYPLDGNANDASGNGYNGTIYGNPPQFITGKIGSAMKFDGVDDYVSLPALPGSPEATITGWMQWHQFNYASRFFDFGIWNYSITVFNFYSNNELVYDPGFGFCLRSMMVV